MNLRAHGVAFTSACVLLITCVGMVISGCTSASPSPHHAPAHHAPSGSSAARPTPSASANPTPVFAGVDPEDYPVDTRGMGSSPLHGASFDAPDRDMHCGIYDNWWVDVDNDVRGLMFGCRMETGYTFTYPTIPNRPDIGGCPSGFTVTQDEPTKVLCNSGMVFASEMQTAKQLLAGQRIVYAGVQCEGMTDGIRCINLHSGHGFTLTPSDYTLF